MASNNTEHSKIEQTAGPGLSAELTQLRRRVAELKVATGRQEQMLRQMVAFQERERRLLAYEIHDGLAQQLAGAWLHLQALPAAPDRNSDDAQAAVSAAIESLRRAMQEARALVAGLRPPVLDDKGLVAAIDDLVRRAREEGGPVVEFTHAVEISRLAPLLEAVVFRIVQESLANARRHSGSKTIRIELAERKDWLWIKIRDWGVGFDPAAVKPDRFGLQGIQERARLFGGRAEIRSAPGKGTQITVELPLALPPTAAD